MNILSYNFYCRPRHIFYDEQIQRAYKLKYALEDKNYDVIMFQELFDNKVHKIIKKDMKSIGFKYKSRRVGKKFDPRMNGGCKIFSKFPILEQDQIIFRPGQIFNIMSSKGANYCKIDKNNKIYHFVNVHLDSFDEDKRTEQMCMIKTWINSKNIPNDEIIIIGGDFNIDYHEKEIKNVPKCFGDKFLLNPHSKSNIVWKNYSCYNQNDWAVRRDKDKNELNELLDFYVIKKPINSKLNITTTKSIRFTDNIFANQISFSTPFYFNIYNIFKKKFQIKDLSDHYGISIQVDNY